MCCINSTNSSQQEPQEQNTSQENITQSSEEIVNSTTHEVIDNPQATDLIVTEPQIHSSSSQGFVIEQGVNTNCSNRYYHVQHQLPLIKFNGENSDINKYNNNSNYNFSNTSQFEVLFEHKKKPIIHKSCEVTNQINEGFFYIPNTIDNNQNLKDHILNPDLDKNYNINLYFDNCYQSLNKDEFRSKINLYFELMSLIQMTGNKFNFELEDSALSENSNWNKINVNILSASEIEPADNCEAYFSENLIIGNSVLLTPSILYHEFGHHFINEDHATSYCDTYITDPDEYTLCLLNQYVYTPFLPFNWYLPFKKWLKTNYFASAQYENNNFVVPVEEYTSSHEDDIEDFKTELGETHDVLNGFFNCETCTSNEASQTTFNCLYDRINNIDIIQVVNEILYLNTLCDHQCIVNCMEEDDLKYLALEIFEDIPGKLNNYLPSSLRNFQNFLKLSQTKFKVESSPKLEYKFKDYKLRDNIKIVFNKSIKEQTKINSNLIDPIKFKDIIKIENNNLIIDVPKNIVGEIKSFNIEFDDFVNNSGLKINYLYSNLEVKSNKHLTKLLKVTSVLKKGYKLEYKILENISNKYLEKDFKYDEKEYVENRLASFYTIRRTQLYKQLIACANFYKLHPQLDLQNKFNALKIEYPGLMFEDIFKPEDKKLLEALDNQIKNKYLGFEVN